MCSLITVARGGFDPITVVSCRIMLLPKAIPHIIAQQALVGFVDTLRQPCSGQVVGLLLVKDPEFGSSAMVHDLWGAVGIYNFTPIKSFPKLASICLFHKISIDR